MRLYYCFVILLLLAGLFFLSGCIKEEEFPPEPYIEFIGLAKIQNANNIDDKGILKISFTDGDGDMGLADNDTMQPFDKSSIYYYNFFIKYFENSMDNLWKCHRPLLLIPEFQNLNLTT